MFDRALELAAVGPNEALMVGDDPIADVRGVQALGLRPFSDAPEPLRLPADVPPGCDRRPALRAARRRCPLAVGRSRATTGLLTGQVGNPGNSIARGPDCFGLTCWCL